MSGPTVADPASMVGQFYDGEAISLASVDWVPTVAGKSFARAIVVGTAGGTLKVDFLGTAGSGGSVGVTITAPVGVLQVAVTKVYKTGTAATGLTALY